MTPYKDILKLFVNSDGIGSWEINGLPDNYPAWVIRLKSEYGVAVKVSNFIDINETFSNITIDCRPFSISDGSESYYLILLSTLFSEDYYDKFAMICTNFVFTSDDGSNRKELIKDPFKWWKEWKQLIGNVDRLKEPYSVIAEMLSLESLIASGEIVVWEGPKGGLVDIRGINLDCEVKSSINRYADEITLSSELQLKKGKNPLHLYYCAFEKSESGVSVEDMVERLVDIGMDRHDIESNLNKEGLPKGKASRIEKYNLLKFWDFVVDDSFPKVVPESFKGDQLPPGISRIRYTVDLHNIEHYELTIR